MNKIFINTVDKVKEYEFLKAYIVTPKYVSQIKQNEVHSSKSAKIIIESKDKMMAFITMLPLIRVNSKGDIYVFTISSYDEATMQTKQLSKKERIELKKQIRELKVKARWGISTQEIFELENLEASLAAAEVQSKYVTPEIGGGF